MMIVPVSEGFNSVCQILFERLSESVGATIPSGGHFLYRDVEHGYMCMLICDPLCTSPVVYRQVGGQCCG